MMKSHTAVFLSGRKKDGDSIMPGNAIRKGAGLGFADTARKSDAKPEYEFAEMNAGYAFFRMKVNVSRQKKQSNKKQDRS